MRKYEEFLEKKIEQLLDERVKLVWKIKSKSKEEEISQEVNNILKAAHELDHNKINLTFFQEELAREKSKL